MSLKTNKTCGGIEILKSLYNILFDIVPLSYQSKAHINYISVACLTR